MPPAAHKRCSTGAWLSRPVLAPVARPRAPVLLPAKIMIGRRTGAILPLLFERISCRQKIAIAVETGVEVALSVVYCSTADLASRHVGARQTNTPLGVPTFEPNRKDLQIQKIRLASKSREPRSFVRRCGAFRALVAPYSFYCGHARAHDPHGATGPADMGTVAQRERCEIQ